MPDEIEHWLRINRQKKVYVLRQSQSLRHVINPTLEPNLNYDPDSLLPALDASRAIKDHDEIIAIREAIRISSIARELYFHRHCYHIVTILKVARHI